MAETTTNSPKKRYAVVTGANKGIGFEICKQLASNGITVVLTARNEKRGLEAVHKLSESGLSDHVVFHQFDVMDAASIASLADFVKTQFGKLDILVNNAGIGGAQVEGDAFKASVAAAAAAAAAATAATATATAVAAAATAAAAAAAAAAGGGVGSGGTQVNWNNIMTESYELAKECLETNYYGAKRTIEALTSLLQLSDSPKIVNVSSGMGMLKNIPSEWAKEVLSDVEKLTEERVDEVLNEFLKDFKQGTLESKGWPRSLSAYTVSKAAMNAYTRILAKKYPNFCINCASPGFVKTDLNFNTGILRVEEGAETAVGLALLPDGGPSGLFFESKEELPF